MIKYKVKILDIIDENEEVRSYILEKPEGLSWQEGAHMHIAIPGFDDTKPVNKNLVHHMSISSLMEDDLISFTTRIKRSPSVFKEELASKSIGDELIIFKVASRMTLKREKRKIVLISMGVGIATMKPLVYSFIKNSEDIISLTNINISSKDENIFKKDLSQFKNKSYRNSYVNSRQDLYLALEDFSGEDIFYLVGSDEFLRDIISYLRQRGIDSSHIIIDKKEEKRREFFN